MRAKSITRASWRPGPHRRQLDLAQCLLFLTSAHAADLILARQAEGKERARGLRGTQSVARVGEDDVAGADIDAAAGYGGPGPHRRQLDLAQCLTGRGIERDQLAAHQSREVDD